MYSLIRVALPESRHVDELANLEKDVRQGVSPLGDIELADHLGMKSTPVALRTDSKAHGRVVIALDLLVRDQHRDASCFCFFRDHPKHVTSPTKYVNLARTEIA